jgi:PknH-like extracellular domain
MSASRRITAAILAALALTTGCTEHAASHPRSDGKPPPALLEPEQISALLPTEKATADVVGGPHIKILGTTRAIEAFPGSFISDPACFAVLFEAAEPAYRDSGYGPVRGYTLLEPDGEREHSIGEAVVLFHTPLDADKLVSRIAAGWSKCANTFLTVHPTETGPQNYLVDSPKVVDDVNTLFSFQEGGGGWGCSHGLTSRLNVVIDVRVCSGAGEVDLTHQTTTLVHMIAAKTPIW